MTTSSGLLKIKTSDIFALGIMWLLTTIVGTLVLLNPYGRETLPIPALSGIFYRSIFMIFIVTMIWIYRYGWVKAFWLLPTYYIFHETIFLTIWFGVYGINILNTIKLSTPFWDIRIIPFPFVIYLLYHYKMFNINIYSTIFGILNLLWFGVILTLWPWAWLYGEGNIPLQPIPQIQEMIYNILSLAWFYFLVRYKNAN